MKAHISPYWDEKLVMAYMEEAAAIHRRLPEVRPAGFRSLWPKTIADDWERLYDMINGKTKLGSPMPAEVTFHEEVMATLRYLERKRQVTVWMRANRIPWKILVDELDRSKQTLWREMRSSLGEIAARLNVLDSDGKKFSRLRSRANGIHVTDGTLASLQKSIF